MDRRHRRLSLVLLVWPLAPSLLCALRVGVPTSVAVPAGLRMDARFASPASLRLHSRHRTAEARWSCVRDLVASRPPRERAAPPARAPMIP